jgi:hypothetical protein
VLAQLAAGVAQRERAIGEPHGHRALETGLGPRDELGHEPLESRVERRSGGFTKLVGIVDEDVAPGSEQIAVDVRQHRFQERRIGGARRDGVELGAIGEKLHHGCPNPRLSRDRVQGRLVHELEVRARRALEGAQVGRNPLPLLRDELDRAVRSRDQYPRPPRGELVELVGPFLVGGRQAPVHPAGAGHPAVAWNGDHAHRDAAPEQGARNGEPAVGAVEDDGA